MAPETRNERIAVRVPASVKAKVMRAAEMEGRSTSDLLIEYMRRATDEIFARNRHIALANADWDVFTDALAKPPEPGSALTHAATVIARATAANVAPSLSNSPPTPVATRSTLQLGGL